MFGNIVENLDEKWLVNGYDVCENKITIFIKELNSWIKKTILSCMTDIDDKALSFLFHYLQVVLHQVQVLVAILMIIQMKILSNLF